MKLSRLLLLIASISTLILGGCASTNKDPTAAYQNQTEDQIFRQGEINLAKRSYSKAVEQFEAVDALYPFGVHSEQTDLDLMYAYYKSDDVASAAATADRYIRLYPRSEHADYAYYMKGLADFSQDRGWLQRYYPTDLSQRDPGTTHQAFDDFNALIQMFPDSVYAPDARQHMVFLRNLFAGYELHVADYYYSRRAYIAAANRASYVLQHYDGTPEVEQALGIMVQAYRKLGLTELANNSLLILQLNFPHGQVLKNLPKTA